MPHLYKQANARTINLLDNDLTTTRHDLDHVTTSIGNNIDRAITSHDLLNELAAAQGEVYYTIPVGLSNPTIADIVGVHLCDYSDCILAELTDLKNPTEDQLRYLVRELIKNLPQTEYQVVIESKLLRGGEPYTIDSVIEVKAAHALAAITEAFRLLIVVILKDLYAHQWQYCEGDNQLEYNAKHGEPMTYKTCNNSYSLKSIKRIAHAIVLEDI